MDDDEDEYMSRCVIKKNRKEKDINWNRWMRLEYKDINDGWGMSRWRLILVYNIN